ncbi:hypothetical protein [Limnovirga soli]|jgi:periplasmic mercuric ion binding protein|uniref:HMA domain-containing protein n=1 Tax=Limnovirga soli TaxID=2656915 RepID=A0A8J8JT26_9BACT|nr:hypothetical protein [Limnovirga soli]NNV57617.1 hypothetical protein [Limnovirga soli]
MKKGLIILLLVIAGNIAHSQVMQQKPVWVTISLPQMKCWVCKENLEAYLLQEKGPNGDAGIIKTMINLGAANMRVQYYPDRITLDYIRTSLNNAGYDADSTKAVPEAYNMLPPICKRKEEGGGPQKGKPCNIDPKLLQK